MTPEELAIVTALQERGIKIDEATGRDIIRASVSVIKQDAAKKYPLIDSLALDILFLTLEEFASSLLETEDVDTAMYYVDKLATATLVSLGKIK